MNNEKNSQPVDLDSLIGDNHLQMMKAALPYMSVTEQRFISLFVKFNELRRTVKLFEDDGGGCHGHLLHRRRHREPASPIDMLGVHQTVCYTDRTGSNRSDHELFPGL